MAQDPTWASGGRPGPADPDERGYGQPGGTPPAAQAGVASGLNLLLGMWIVISPWVLGYSQAPDAVWNAVVVGTAIAILALIRTASPLQFEGLSWVNFVLGGWLIVSPLVLSYERLDSVTALTANNVIVGLLVLILAAWSAAMTGRATDRTLRGPRR